MKEWIVQQDFIEWIFALGIVVAGVHAIVEKNSEIGAMCLGAAIMYIKGKINK